MSYRFLRWLFAVVAMTLGVHTLATVTPLPESDFAHWLQLVGMTLVGVALWLVGSKGANDD